MAHFETIYDFYKNVLHRNSYNNLGGEIIANLGVVETTFSDEPLNNAFWMSKYGIGNQIFIGDYNGKSFAASLDILAHEFTHGVVDYTANFDNAPDYDTDKAFEPSALNEAYADIMGHLIEGSDYWSAGEQNGNITRDAVDPSKTGNPSVKGGPLYYPNDAVTLVGIYQDCVHTEGCQVRSKCESVTNCDGRGTHINSTVVSHAAYVMKKAGAFKDDAEMAKIWYSSLKYLKAKSTFEDAALAVLKAAKNYSLSEDSLLKITQAFLDAKILENTNYNLDITVKSNGKPLADAKVDLYPYLNQEWPISSMQTDANGKISVVSPNSAFVFKITKDGYSTFEKGILIKGDTTLSVELKELPPEGENNEPIHISSLTDECKGSKCVTLKVYKFSSDKDERNDYESFSLPKNAVIGSQLIVDALNADAEVPLFETDGSSFYLDIPYFDFIEFGWYYKGTDERFNFDTPITENTEVEMKFFNGFLENGLFENIESWF